MLWWCYGLLQNTNHQSVQVGHCCKWQFPLPPSGHFLSRVGTGCLPGQERSCTGGNGGRCRQNMAVTEEGSRMDQNLEKRKFGGGVWSPTYQASKDLPSRDLLRSKLSSVPHWCCYSVSWGIMMGWTVSKLFHPEVRREGQHSLSTFLLAPENALHC